MDFPISSPICFWNAGFPERVTDVPGGVSEISIIVSRFVKSASWFEDEIPVSREIIPIVSILEGRYLSSTSESILDFTSFISATDSGIFPLFADFIRFTMPETLLTPLSFEKSVMILFIKLRKSGFVIESDSNMTIIESELKSSL